MVGAVIWKWFNRGNTTFVRAVLVLAFLGLVGSLMKEQPEAQSPNEYQVKAAFLFNFIKFVEWPADAFADDNAPLVIGVIGNDPFGSTLDNTVGGKSINGRPLAVRRFSRGQDFKVCHILFVSSSEKNHLAEIIQSLRGTSVLTVGEVAQFNQRGGIINFVLESSKVRFEINAGAAEQSRLKISSKLLVLAKNVRN